MAFVVTLTNGATQIIQAEDYRQDGDFIVFLDMNQRKRAALRASNVKGVRKQGAPKQPG